jgi:hypothetical protein
VLTEGGNTGQGLISKVFRERAGAVMDALARSAGTKSSSASRLLEFAFPILGKQIVSNGLNPGGLAQKLFDQKKAILDDPNTPPASRPRAIAKILPSPTTTPKKDVRAIAVWTWCSSIASG